MQMNDLIRRYYHELIERGYPRDVAWAAAKRRGFFWIIRAREAGMTYNAMGKRLNVSVTRARQMYKTAKRYMALYQTRTPFDDYADRLLD